MSSHSRPVRAAQTASPVSPAVPLPRIVRLPEVCRLTGLSRSSILRLERRGEFPAKFSLGLHAIGWWEAAVVAWIQAKAATPPARTPNGDAP